MPRSLAFPLRQRVPVLFNVYGFSAEETGDVLGTTADTVWRILRLADTVGTTYNPYAQTRGPKCVLSQNDVRFIASSIKNNPCIYLDELQTLIRHESGQSVSIPTLSRTLSKHGYSYKRISKAAAERNRLLRAGFTNLAGTIIQRPDQPIFLDETSKDNKTIQRPRGWSARGADCDVSTTFVRGTRLTLLAGLNVDGIVGCEVYDGSVTGDRFLQFLRDFIMPITNPYPGPNSVIVLDNCRIHHIEPVRYLVEVECLCKLLYLPPYSPDLNPIEEAFSSIKAYLRRHSGDPLTYLAPTASLQAACLSVTPEKSAGWFRHCGWM
ncbi:Tc1-mariner class transposase [Ceratobasidium sp. AG-Ba]|nr:Tc1-mariner class transposase [Ceratobasidium sp. AG-Ba]